MPALVQASEWTLVITATNIGQASPTSLQSLTTVQAGHSHPPLESHEHWDKITSCSHAVPMRGDISARSFRITVNCLQLARQYTAAKTILCIFPWALCIHPQLKNVPGRKSASFTRSEEMAVTSTGLNLTHFWWLILKQKDHHNLNDQHHMTWLQSTKGLK